MSTNLVAMIAVLIIWLGIFLYLVRLDGKVKKLNRK
ncbi:MAG: CcmD family protein [Candidatus Zixiibacteriota bacterium]|nr:MAG: CcmD family protein [candidate division Zixibacteria bacterium]